MPVTDLLGPDDAAHLLRRAGFGAREKEIARFAQLSRAEAVERLLGKKSRKARPPAKADDAKSRLAMQRWWLKQMASPKWRLHEKLALFWHGWFPAGFSQVPGLRALARQNQVFREHGLGPFRTLLYEQTRDGAMLEAFAGVHSRASSPNEAFARALLEQFALGARDLAGVPNYSDADVRALARALTGWTVDSRTSVGAVGPDGFDDGNKTLFAGNVAEATGNLGIEDDSGAPFPPETNVLDLLFAHRDSEDRPTLARHLARALWRWFATPEPTLERVDTLADAFVASGYELRALVEAILLAEEFYAPEARSESAKAPAEFALQALLGLRAKPSWERLAADLARMGQTLFDPPAPFGWPSGAAWQGPGALAERLRFAQALAAGESAKTYAFNAKRFLDKDASDTGQIVDGVLAALRIAPSVTVRQALVDYYDGGAALPERERFDTKFRGLFALALALPESQIH